MQLSGKFIPVAEIRSTSQVSDININNDKPKQGMFIEISTKKTLINKLVEQGDISPAEKQVYDAAYTFYTERFSYAIQKVPINDSVLKHSVFDDISKRAIVLFKEVLYFAEKFKFDYNPAKVTVLFEQFLDYQCSVTMAYQIQLGECL